MDVVTGALASSGSGAGSGAARTGEDSATAAGTVVPLTAALALPGMPVLATAGRSLLGIRITVRRSSVGGVTATLGATCICGSAFGARGAATLAGAERAAAARLRSEDFLAADLAGAGARAALGARAARFLATALVETPATPADVPPPPAPEPPLLIVLLIAAVLLTPEIALPTGAGAPVLALTDAELGGLAVTAGLLGGVPVLVMPAPVTPTALLVFVPAPMPPAAAAAFPPALTPKPLPDALLPDAPLLPAALPPDALPPVVFAPVLPVTPPDTPSGPGLPQQALPTGLSFP